MGLLPRPAPEVRCSGGVLYTVVANVRTLTGFFFGGGDQSRIIYSFYNDDERVPSPVLTAIKEALLSGGGVIAGTSAGSDCQTSKVVSKPYVYHIYYSLYFQVMISGGESYNALRDGTSVFWRSVHPSDAKILAAFGSGGLGLFTYGLLDTHFSNRGRHGRLVELVVDTLSLPAGHTRAFGIDENTALVVTGPWDRRIGTVIGESGVNVFDASTATVMLNDKRNIWHARLSGGDVIDLDSFHVSFAPFKSLMSKNEVDIEPYSSKDIFRVGAFEVDKMAQSLFQSTSRSASGVTFQSSPRFRVKMSKDWSMDNDIYSSALATEGTNPSTGVYSFSYVGLKLDFVDEHE